MSHCLFNLNAEYIIQNAGLDEDQAGIMIPGRSINNLRYADGTTLSDNLLRASLVAQLVKNPPAMWETWVQSPGWEDPLEKG